MFVVLPLRAEQLNKRNTEELAHIKQRSKELELDMLALNQEKQMHFENMTNATVPPPTSCAELEFYLFADRMNIPTEEAGDGKGRVSDSNECQ